MALCERCGYETGSEARRHNYESNCIAILRAEVAEYDAILELQRTRSREADELWQRAHDTEYRPDLSVLLTWLMASIEREAEEKRRALGALLRTTAEVERLQARLAATQQALEEMAELNYNLAHEPASAFGRVTLERDALKGDVERLREALSVYADKDSWEWLRQPQPHFEWRNLLDGRPWEIAEKALTAEE